MNQIPVNAAAATIPALGWGAASTYPNREAAPKPATDVPRASSSAPNTTDNSRPATGASIATRPSSAAKPTANVTPESPTAVPAAASYTVRSSWMRAV